jgi:hypothetical protein
MSPTGIFFFVFSGKVLYAFLIVPKRQTAIPQNREHENYYKHKKWTKLGLRLPRMNVNTCWEGGDNVPASS